MSMLRRFYNRGRPPAEVDDQAPAAGQLTADELRFVGPLIQRTLGRDILPDPSRLSDPEEGARVDLQLLAPILRGTPRRAWEAAVTQYYARAGAVIRRSHELEQRSWTFDEARPHLAAWWRRAADVSEPMVSIGTDVPGVVDVLILQRGDAVRMVMPSMLKRWGVSADEAQTAARERVAAESVDVAMPKWGDTAARRLDTRNGLWASTTLETLDRVAPWAVGALGTVAVLADPKTLLVRPLGFGTGLRTDLGRMAHVLAKWRSSYPDLAYPGLLWRQPTGVINAVEADLAPDNEKLKIDLRDSRFIGVLTAIEPLEELPVPGWATELFDERSYTRFAGMVASTTQNPAVSPADVGARADELQLPGLARICLTVDAEEWWRILAMRRRFAVRWGGDPRSVRPVGPTSLSADEIRSLAGRLIRDVSASIASMPQVLKAGVHGERVAHFSGVVGRDRRDLDVDLIVPIAHTGAGNQRDDFYRLQAVCAIAMPTWAHCYIVPTVPDDPRFDDEAHVVTVRT